MHYSMCKNSAAQSKHCNNKQNSDQTEMKRTDVTIITHPDSDVQLVFVGKENINGSLLLC